MKSALKILKNRLVQQSKSKIYKAGKITTIGIIFPIKSAPLIHEFYALAKHLGVAKDAVFLLGYSTNKVVEQEFDFPVFSTEELSFGAKIKNDALQQYQSRSYDLLINFYDTQELCLSLASSLIQADIRVGFSGAFSGLNDLIFKVPITNFTLFKNELIKYLTILKKL